MTISELKKDVLFWVTGSGTGTTDYADADILRNINEYYNRAVSLILKCDGRWEWDDENFTTLPIATTNLVSSQADYEISETSFLNLLRVEIKDSNGNGIQLQPISQEDKNGIAMTEWAKTNGTPEVYDKVGNSIILYPTPDYSSTLGLKAYFHRPPSLFTSAEMSTGTKAPGFNPLFHRYLSIGAAIDYCTVNAMTDRLSILMPKLIQMENDLVAAYSKRNKDEHFSMRTYKEGYGGEEIYYRENSVG